MFMISYHWYVCMNALVATEWFSICFWSLQLKHSNFIRISTKLLLRIERGRERKRVKELFWENTELISLEFMGIISTKTSDLIASHYWNICMHGFKLNVLKFKSIIIFCKDQVPTHHHHHIIISSYIHNFQYSRRWFE